MTTLFERNEDRVTGFLKWTDFTNQDVLLLATLRYVKDTDYAPLNVNYSLWLLAFFMSFWAQKNEVYFKVI